MGTRGLYAFRYKNRYYSVYVHSDAYLEGLGMTLLKWLRSLEEKDWSFMKTYFEYHDKIEDDLDIIMMNNDLVEVSNWSTLLDSERMQGLKFLTDASYEVRRDEPVKYHDIEYYYEINVETRDLQVKYFVDHTEYHEYHGPICFDWYVQAFKTLDAFVRA
jgi:hypothetical protein